jgi:hypothetical protein
MIHGLNVSDVTGQVLWPPPRPSGIIITAPDAPRSCVVEGVGVGLVLRLRYPIPLPLPAFSPPLALPVAPTRARALPERAPLVEDTTSCQGAYKSDHPSQ